MMSLKSNTAVLVMAGAVPGVILRYLLGLYVPHYFNLPIGTLAANVLGSFILGMLVTMFRIGVASSNIITLGGIGFCGSLTTMSTFAVESLSFIDSSIYLLVLNVLITLGLVMLGAYVGRVLTLYVYLTGDE